MENNFQSYATDLSLLEKEGEVNNPKSLGIIFEKQRALMDTLITKNSMVPYPLDINLKENQSYIRNIMAYAIQELSESYDVYSELVNHMEQAQKDHHKIYKAVVDFNEELADYFHFLVELVILCGLDESSINTYYEKLLKDANVETLYFPDDLMKTALGYARFINGNAGRILLGHKFYDIKPIIGIHFNSRSEWILAAGRKVSPDLLNIYDGLMWKIVHHSYTAMNKLKKKPWRESGPTTDLQTFLEALMEAWLYSFCLFDFAGHTDYSLYTTYKIKNHINIERINNNY